MDVTHRMITELDADHATLLARIAARDAGSEAAMAQLYRALSGAVFAFVRRRLSLADDHAVQAVVVDTMYEFAAGSQVKTWVLGIARHKLLDAVRKDPHAQRGFDDIADHADTLADESPDIVTQLAHKQRAEWLAYCMDKLPEDQRESLHLLLVEGLSVSDIASVQNCPGGTVKTRVFHAKAKLKNCLARWLKHDGDDGHGGAARPSNKNHKEEDLV
jgi:RNA polymerase sigma-70 factor, ECF subfamily